MVTLAFLQEDGPVPLEALAERQGIPERYLAKIVQDLRRSGLIRSVRGAHGGYCLSRPAAEISLLDVYEALEGSFCPVDCLDTPGSCGRTDGCTTRGVWQELREAVVGVMQARTLEDLAQQSAHRAAGGTA